MTDRAPRPEGMGETAVTRLIQENSYGVRRGIVGVWNVGSLEPERLTELRQMHEPEYVYAEDYDALFAEVSRLRADGATLKVRADEAHAAHAASFGALATLSAALFNGEVDDYAELAEKIIARVKQAEADGATLRERVKALRDIIEGERRWEILGEDGVFYTPGRKMLALFYEAFPEELEGRSSYNEPPASAPKEPTP